MNRSKLWPAAVLAIGLIITGACIALIMDHRPVPYNGPVTEVTSDNFEAEVIKSTLPVYVEFYVDFSKCEHCARQQPVIDKLANEYKGRVKFVRINALANRDIAAGARITAVPTHFFFPSADASPIGARGVLSEEQLRALLERGLSGKRPAAPTAPAAPTEPAPAAPAAPAAPTPTGNPPAVQPKQ